MSFSVNSHIRRVAYLNSLIGIVGAGLIFFVWFAFAPLWENSVSMGLTAIPMVAIHSLFCFLVVVSLIQACAGFFLLKGSLSSVFLVRVVSIIGLFSPPVGTLLGCYSLWVLSSHYDSSLNRPAGA